MDIRYDGFLGALTNAHEALMLEHLLIKQMVGGSIPSNPAIYICCGRVERTPAFEREPWRWAIDGCIVKTA